MKLKAERPDATDRKASAYEDDGRRIRTHTGKLRPGRKAGRIRHPDWNKKGLKMGSRRWKALHGDE